MPTNWFYANTITQEAEATNHISWSGEPGGFFEVKNDDPTYVAATSPLLHISNMLVNDLRMKTWYLYFKDFRIIECPDIISGIEVMINMKRGGRITDDIIQLRYNDTFIGGNKADAILDPIKIYGSSTDLWSADLTSSMVQDSEFGIGIRFQSHPNWPHKETPMINYVKIRVW